ncbi:MAG TPA: cellulose binding domain-containing protein [Streptosporangiaceae bacterium]
MGLRRIVVTPTFAAGLGVVIAAIIAYPLTRTVISYGREPPTAGHPCLITGCATATPGDGGLATAKPGRRLVPPHHKHHRAGTAGAAATGPRPVMTYQTVHQWPGGFVGQVVITMPAGPVPASWQLRLSYQSGTITSVWGGSWAPRSPHTVTVTAGGQNDPGTQGGRSQGDVQIFLTVTGPPGPPSGCAFNGEACARG